MRVSTLKFQSLCLVDVVSLFEVWLKLRLVQVARFASCSIVELAGRPGLLSGELEGTGNCACSEGICLSEAVRSCAARRQFPTPPIRGK